MVNCKFWAAFCIWKLMWGLSLSWCRIIGFYAFELVLSSFFFLISSEFRQTWNWLLFIHWNSHHQVSKQGSLLFQLWHELRNFLVVENCFSFKSAVIFSEYNKGGPTSHHLSNHAEIHHFYFKALQKFLTGIVFWHSCQQLACDTFTWLNILACTVGLSSCSIILVLCLYTPAHCRLIAVEVLPYFSDYKTHFFSWKMWPKIDLCLIRRG